MSKTLSGGCACGTVRYALASDPVDSGWCHCRICQPPSGAPALVFPAVPRQDFAFTRGAERVGTFRSSDFGHRLFCRDCGTPLAMEVDYEPKTIDFSVATLDDPGAVPPEFHIFYESRVSWFEPGDSLPKHTRFRRVSGSPDETAD